MPPRLGESTEAVAGPPAYEGPKLVVVMVVELLFFFMLLASSCIGCGACVAACPQEALALAPPPPEVLIPLGGTGPAVAMCREWPGAARAAVARCIHGLSDAALAAGPHRIAVATPDCAACPLCPPETLFDRVARLNALAADRGRAGIELRPATPAEARAALSEARARHAELDAALTDHEAQASVHRARQESLTTLRAEVDRLEAAGRVVDDLRRARAAADAELDRAVAAHDAASGALRERRALIARAEDEQRRHDDLSAATAVAAERMAPAQARADRARAELEAAEEAGMQTAWLVREGDLPKTERFVARDFAEVDTLLQKR